MPQGGVNAVAFQRAEALVALACEDGTVRVFDAKDGKEGWQQKAHAQDALAVAFGPKDAIATGGADGKMALFADDGKALGTSAGVGDYLLGVGFWETDAVVFGADAKGSVQRWAGKTVEVVTGLRGGSRRSGSRGHCGQSLQVAPDLPRCAAKRCCGRADGEALLEDQLVDATPTRVEPSFDEASFGFAVEGAGCSRFRPCTSGQEVRVDRDRPGHRGSSAPKEKTNGCRSQVGKGAEWARTVGYGRPYRDA